MYIKKYDNYLQKIADIIGNNNFSFSTTPIILNKYQFNKIRSISEMVLDIIMDEDFYMNQYPKSWFLPKTKLSQNDFIGSIDFHIIDNSQKIIEINLSTIGKINLIELMEQTALNCLNDKSLIGKSSFFLEQLIDSIHQNKYKNIAICDWDVNNQPNLIEFQYLKKTLESKKLNVNIENATDLFLNKNNIIVGKHKKNYDRIYNRLVPSQWRENIDQLKGLTDIFVHNHNVFYNNPNAWILSNKNLLKELSKINSKLINYIPKSELLSKFESVDQIKNMFGSTRKIIIKPSDEFASSGVYYKPSNIMVNNLIEQKKDMIVQEFCPPGKLEYIHTDKECYNLKYDLRVVFVDGKIKGLTGRVYEGAITNFRSPKGGFAPVFISEK